MPIAIHWDWEGHSASKPLQSSCTETLLAPRTALRAAARAVQIFAVFIFEYGASFRNTKICTIRKFPAIRYCTRKPLQRDTFSK